MRQSAAILLVAVATAIFAQPPTAFVVASVKTVDANSGWIAPVMVDPQRFRARTIVSQLIYWAYGLRDFQILGAPAWLGRDRFEIEATVERPSSKDQIQQMVQTLLAERFRLKLHRETREIPVFALVVGNNGPKLTTAKDDDLTCGGDGCFSVENGTMHANSGTMSRFVLILTPNLNRPVVDRTNLTGHYDFSLTYDQSSVNTNIPTPTSEFHTEGPSIFTAVQDIGLKLEPQKVPFEMLVIDSVDHPSQN